ncbi:hypothetical protein RYX36_021576 [Vicia faba]
MQVLYFVKDIASRLKAAINDAKAISQKTSLLLLPSKYLKLSVSLTINIIAVATVIVMTLSMQRLCSQAGFIVFQVKADLHHYLSGGNPVDHVTAAVGIWLANLKLLLLTIKPVENHCHPNLILQVFVNDQFLNWDPENRIKVRIVSARAYHSLFMHNMCIRPSPEELENFGTPDFTIYNAGKFPCNRFTHYMTSSTSIDLNLARREMVILGTQYVGEMKKGLFSVMHYLMPKRQILSLHSGCNMGKDGDVALFFGLSGTGKTTLSTDHNRYLIGDDEHCWSENGVSNIEGGCYAKCIDLSREKEPDIWNAIRFGTVLENVVFDEHTREVDYSDKSVTENTRAAYPIEYIPNAKLPCVGPHPKNVILLACDAFGVLPPVSKLNLAQTMYHFISGYTALVAGTEDGIKEPQATFSACFGAAFIMLHPTKYAAMLAEKMESHGATGWLVNTGWSGGSYGTGNRIKLSYTRKIIDVIHNGSLLKAEYKKSKIFGLETPTAVEGVPSEILDPVNAWTDKDAYNETLLKFAGLFRKFFETFTNYTIGKGGDNLTEEILAAGPIF